MRQVLLSLCRQMLCESNRATNTAAVIVLAKERLQKRRRAADKSRAAIPGPSRGRRKAAVAVEFIVLLPLLIVLGLTSVDFGRFAHTYIALGNAARVGAEYGATRSYSPSTATAWRQQIGDAMRQEFAAVADIDPSQLAIQIDVVSDSYDLHRTTITATYPFRTVVTWPMIPQPLDLQRATVYRRFR
ncbi:MAG TPA: TadE/TadG family type IV pilus assembly protein [Pirellulaceae bacterium]